MSISKLFARLAAAAAFAWAGGSVSAADVAPPVQAAPAVIGSAPVIEAAPGGCPTCQGGVAGCSTCGKKCGGLFQKHKPPFQVTLCPGACFGYFQTQWRKWDDVCPYPYLGHGVSDAMRVPGAARQAGPDTAPAPTLKGGELTKPRPVDPKMPDPKAPMTVPVPKKAGSDLPAIPPMPPAPGKFVP
jgi:hypothetical protein